MNFKQLQYVCALLVLTLLLTACGGGSGGTANIANTAPDGTGQTPGGNETTTLTAVQKSSLEATSKNIEEAILAAQSEALFNTGSHTINGVTTKATLAEETNLTQEKYHLADVIFTLGSDNLDTAEGKSIEVDAAYNYFVLNVVKQGKLSDEDAEKFSIMTKEEFNEEFVAGYYQAAAPVVDVSDEIENVNLAAVPLATVIPKYTTALTNKIATSGMGVRFFGFFKFFNPFTYLNIFINIAKAVMTAILAETFKLMLLSGTMTKLMLRLALRFPILTNVMIHVLSSYWGITRRMIPYLKYDTEFGELFMQLAYEQSNMAHFVFQNIDGPLYYGMGVAMTRSKTTTERLSVMMNWYAQYYFVAPQPATRYNNFVRLLLNNGQVIAEDGQTNHGDGNELASEKLYYSLFKSSFATKQFIGAMDQVEGPMLGALMDHIFLGLQRNPADGSIVVDDMIQGNYNIFAIAQGMLEGMQSEGFGPYIRPLMDFAFLIPEDRYLPYAQAFAMAGYTYYAQNVYEGEGQPTMQDFMQFLMGTISTQLAQVDPAYGEDAQAFGQMLQSLQPYIDEFMQNGMANIAEAPLVNEVPDINEIDGDINDPIEDPLEQAVQNPPAPSTLIDIIYKFPVLWEKDYSNEGYKGIDEETNVYNGNLSNSRNNPNYNLIWDQMSAQLSDLNWMHIPSSAYFSSTSRFDFIFKEGSVDMYVISNSDFITQWQDNGLSLTDTGERITVRNIISDNLDDFSAYKVYKVTIAAGTSLGHLDTLMLHLDGIAFDLEGTKPVAVAEEEPTEAPTPPPVPEEDEVPVDENNTVIEPVEPPVVEAPQTVTLSSVFNINTLTYMSEADYSNSAYTGKLVNQPWWPGETWTAMPEWLSNLTWVDIEQNTYISSSQSLNILNFGSGTVDIYLVTTHANLPWLLEMNGLSNISLNSAITSTEGQTFYVFKRTMQQGESIEKLWLMMNNISGLAFDTSNVVLN